MSEPTVGDAQAAGVQAAVVGAVTGAVFVAAAALFDVDSKLWRALVGLTVVGVCVSAVLLTSAQRVAVAAGYWFKARPQLGRLFGVTAAVVLVATLAFWDVGASWWRAALALVFVLVVGAVYAGAPTPAVPPR